MSDHSIFEINNDDSFREYSLQLFRKQYSEVAVYKEFCDALNRDPDNVTDLDQIPFLPIEFFKSRRIISNDASEEIIFTSSGTTGPATSKHYVADLELYESSFLKNFELTFGPINELVILALLPSYLEREGSSLVYMTDRLISLSENPDSGFYLDNMEELISKLETLESRKQKTLLFGVSFALLDLIESQSFHLKNTIVMETGGMKGRRKEMIREDLHAQLKKGFNVPTIYSEYGMTELLSQAYSKGEGIFQCPPWMKIMTRDTEDPLSFVYGNTGGINVIDLANQNSCSFIATQDLGKVFEDGSFEILGRFDHSDIRGCNLMVL